MRVVITCAMNSPCCSEAANQLCQGAIVLNQRGLRISKPDRHGCIMGGMGVHVQQSALILTSTKVREPKAGL